MKVRELQRAGEGEHEGNVVIRGECGHGSVGVGDGARDRRRKRGDAAC